MSLIGVVLSVIVLLILLLISALVSGSEVAFFSLSPGQKQLVDNGEVGSWEYISLLLSKPKQLLATILIANNFVNVAIILLSSLISQQLFNPNDLYLFGFVIKSGVIIFLINTLIITFIILMLGEVIPKVYASRYPLRLIGLTAYPLNITYRILDSIKLVNLLVSSTTFLDKSLKNKVEKVTSDDLQIALELTSKEEMQEEDHKILEGVVRFGETDVKQIMTPRVNVVDLDMNDNFEVARETILESGFSRIPVYQEQIDQIKGVLYAKDLLPFLGQEDFTWHTLIRKAYFVPENKKIDDLLNEFQARKIHMAFVVDEYGGYSGIVTLEDIIEEIVGDISDEFDDEEIHYSKLDASTFVFDAQISLNDMYRVLDISGDDFEESKGEADSLAGFVLEISGKIPLKNEKCSFGNWDFIIEAADRRRIKRVKVVRKENPSDES
ncbi:MAG TPA: hypothetical protein DDX92_03770 [Flavobacteriales bacterium]|jgi:putative hemolysin|nr:hypothetical protein [Flavobacteriales bacterium]